MSLFTFSLAIAQQGTSSLRGTVADQQGNVVTGATVTLTNIATKAVRTVTTGEGGTYGFDYVTPGDYRVEVEGKGFKKGVVNDVHALIAKTVTVDVTLEVGNVTESVTVNASASEALVNRDDATIGNNFVSKQILELPLEAKNVPNLLTLQPATTREGNSAGARSDQSNITLDGVDINDAQTNQILGTDPADSTNTVNLQPGNSTVLRLNSEAIEEFRVTTSNPNANQGRSSGAQISLVTKGGGNDWHGSLFEFYRTKAFTANDFFNNKNGIERPSLIRHTFGGALGGPIVKERLFFFYSFEADRIAQSTPVGSARNVPLASLGTGVVRYLNPAGGITTLTTAQLNTLFPAVGINQAAVTALAQAAARYPANDSSVGDGLNVGGFRFNAPIPVTRNSHSGRLDLNLTSKQQVFARANVIYDNLTRERQFPDSVAPNIWSHPIGIAAGHTWTISNSLVNNFRFGYTREAFTQQGDSAASAVTFRFVFSPLTFSRTLTRITPVRNFTDDLSWVKGKHTFSFGGNIRLIRNKRDTFANAYDSAVTNPSFYSGGGNAISTPINTFSPINGSRTGVQNAVTALIGRFSQYNANFTFNRDGSLLSSGSPSAREFRTEEYDGYFQDTWKLSSSLTLTYGLRYSISRPVYEKNGFEVRTTENLTDFFNRRREGAARGVAVNDPLTLDLSGPANNKPYLYNYDKNNFQPRIAAAWSPSFRSGFLGKLFGDNKSVVRGGFAMTNDYYGQQLAVSFDLNNTLGFSSSNSISANTFNVTTRPAPLFTGFGQAIRPLPGITVPGIIRFPRTQTFNPDPAAQQRRIESTLDSKLVAPVNYSWNLTFERDLPHGMVIQTSYIGRIARNLIASRDVMALNNLVDPRSGQDWYTAATQLEILRQRGASISSVPNIAWFQNVLPSNIAALINANYFGGTVLNESLNQTQAIYQFALEVFDNDWTDTQDGIEAGLGRNIFFHPQYGALSAFSSIAQSNFHAGTLTVRQRLGAALTMDFNYTLSHSHDDASGLQTSAAFGDSFILNPLRQRDNYAESDFDVRQIINANAVWQLPFGKGRFLFGNASKVADAFLGGWQLSGIFRWNTGLPISSPFDDARWATNWNVQSNVVRAKDFKTCPVRGGKLFGCNTVAAYSGFRNAYPGETGDRNVFRLPGYVTLDMGLSKSLTMPWSEKHKLQLRLEGFNITNTQRMGGIAGGRDGYGISNNPQNVTTISQIPPAWANFVSIQGKPRVLQIGLRYSF